MSAFIGFFCQVCMFNTSENTFASLTALSLSSNTNVTNKASTNLISNISNDAQFSVNNIIPLIENNATANLLTSESNFFNKYFYFFINKTKIL